MDLNSIMLRNTADRGVRNVILDVIRKNNGISLSDLQDVFADYIPAEKLESKTFEMKENLFLMEQDGKLQIRSHP